MPLAGLNLPRIAFVFAVVFSTSSWSADQWRIEDGSVLEFQFTQMGGKVIGKFDGFSGDIRFSPDDLEKSAITIIIRTPTAHTNSKERDDALKTAAFLDVGTHALATFQATDITLDGQAYLATGTLTLKGVEKPYALPFSVEIIDDTAHANGTLTINRIDFGIGTGEWAPADAIGHEVLVEFSISATRVPAN